MIDQIDVYVCILDTISNTESQEKPLPQQLCDGCAANQ